MRSIAHHDHGQKPERMKFLRILFACPEGAGKWRILFFAMRLHRKKKTGAVVCVLSACRHNTQQNFSNAGGHFSIGQSGKRKKSVDA